jgi:phosphoribosylformimino-5-aminoimidazole carboxamide ribotide isomerase
MAAPSAASDLGISSPERPPPVTHSWTRRVIIPEDFMPSQEPRVIPVLDLKAGRAVHAVGGERSHYAVLRSLLHPSSEPLSIAQAYRDALGLDEPYLADLDAISGGHPALPFYAQLIDQGFRPWIDAGIRSAGDVLALGDLAAATIVLGLETLRGPEALPAILDRIGPDRAVLSVDLFNGIPRTAAGSAWPSGGASELVRYAIRLGVRRLLILDLARVGRGGGTGTEALLAIVRDRHPEAEVSVGGGISTIEDVAALGRAGASAVLVGSALHDGRIGARSLRTLHPTSPAPGEPCPTRPRPLR